MGTASQIATSVSALTAGLSGHCSVSLDSMHGSTVPSVLSGSCLEVADALFQWTTDEVPQASTWTSITTTSTVYMVCTPSGSAGSQILTTSYTTTVPTWVAGKYGWYASAASNTRAIAQLTKGGETAYNNKALLTPKSWRKQTGGSTKIISATSYTILDDDGIDTVILASTALTGTVMTVLPTAADNVDRRIKVRTLNAHGTYQMVVDGEGAETINGYADWRMNGIYQRVDLVCTGTEWVVEGTAGTVREISNATDVDDASPTDAAWENYAATSLTIEPGVWVVAWGECVLGSQPASGNMTIGGGISASATSMTNLEWAQIHRATHDAGEGPSQLICTFCGTHVISVVASTTLYLMAEVDGTSPDLLRINGAATKTFLRAERIR